MLNRYSSFRLPVFVCGILLFLCMHAQAQYPFKKEYVSAGFYEGLTKFTSTHDHGTVSISSSQNISTSVSYFDIIKTDSLGNLQWTKRFGPVRGTVKEIYETPDSGYFFCYSDLGTQLGYYAIKLNQNGNVIFKTYLKIQANWHVTYLGSKSIVRNDGGFYIATYLLDFVTADYIWHLCSVDNSGNILWSNGYNLTSVKSVMCDLDTCDNGDVVLLGEFYNTVTQDYSTMITRIQPDGTWLWSKYFSSTTTDIIPCALTIIPGDIIYIAAKTMDQSATQVILIKADGNGNPLWSYRYGVSPHNLVPVKIECVENGNLVVISQTFFDSYVLKTDSVGIIAADRLFSDQILYDMDTLSGTGYLFSGQTTQASASILLSTNYAIQGCDDTTALFTKQVLPLDTGSYSGFMNIALQDSIIPFPEVPLSMVVNTPCGPLSTYSQEASFSMDVFPNPATSFVNVSSAQQFDRVEMIDIHGRIMLTEQCNTNCTDIDISGFADGIYFVRIVSESGEDIRKIVVRH